MLALSLASPAPVQAEEPESGSVRGAMRQIAAPLEVALPLSLSEERFADPANRAELSRALEELARSAALLEEHGKEREASFAIKSRALARDSAELDRRFREGHLEEARYLLGMLVGDCIGCHARLPSPGDSDLGGTLFRSVDTSSLDPFETIQLQLMTRQFESALAGCETLLASTRYTPERLDLENVPEDLLLLATRIEQAPARARKAIDGFGARADASLHLRETASQWGRSLDEIAGQPTPADPLVAARTAAERAQALTRYPGDRNGTVYDLHAASLLHKHLDRSSEQATLPAAQRAEAYYLLGLGEMRRSESFWPSEADLYLEQAIRTAPGSALARQAYAVIEEQYTSGGAMHLPDEIAGWLRELRTLAVGA